MLTGHLNTPLNDTGRSQAQTVAERLIDEEGVRFDKAFSSDSDRASDVSCPAAVLVQLIENVNRSRGLWLFALACWQKARKLLPTALWCCYLDNDEADVRHLPIDSACYPRETGHGCDVAGTGRIT
ncbi:hypothetical protein QFC19_006177 [Naganishia cerealis]|uniref:Uncharacterized protein n=1 Tax=Naganishia cerealis TaxID=610337 RepID=A0ACC2VII5_9TREE|nr:hypothetical protein QFC19_006177 [Naganishia cerealis]